MKKYRLLDIIRVKDNFHYLTLFFPRHKDVDGYNLKLFDLVTNKIFEESVGVAIGFKEDIFGYYDNGNGNSYCFSIVDDTLWHLIDIVDMIDVDYATVNDTGFPLKSSSSVGCCILNLYKDKLIASIKSNYYSFETTAFINDGYFMGLSYFIECLVKFSTDSLVNNLPIYIVGPNNLRKQLIYDNRLLRFYTKSKVLRR